MLVIEAIDDVGVRRYLRTATSILEHSALTSTPSASRPFRTPERTPLDWLMLSPCLTELQQEMVWSLPQRAWASLTVMLERTWRGTREERGVVAAKAVPTRARMVKGCILKDWVGSCWIGKR